IFTARSALYRSYSNITLLERPVRSEVLLSAVEAALRARMRQYEVRDYMNRQAESQDALRRTEKLAVAGRMAASIAHEDQQPFGCNHQSSFSHVHQPGHGSHQEVQRHGPGRAAARYRNCQPDASLLSRTERSRSGEAIRGH